MKTFLSLLSCWGPLTVSLSACLFKACRLHLALPSPPETHLGGKRLPLSLSCLHIISCTEEEEVIKSQKHSTKQTLADAADVLPVPCGHFGLSLTV